MFSYFIRDPNPNITDFINYLSNNIKKINSNTANNTKFHIYNKNYLNNKHDYIKKYVANKDKTMTYFIVPYFSSVYYDLIESKLILDGESIFLELDINKIFDFLDIDYINYNKYQVLKSNDEIYDIVKCYRENCRFLEIKYSCEPDNVDDYRNFFKTFELPIHEKKYDIIRSGDILLDLYKKNLTQSINKLVIKTKFNT